MRPHLAGSGSGWGPLPSLRGARCPGPAQSRLLSSCREGRGPVGQRGADAPRPRGAAVPAVLDEWRRPLGPAPDDPQAHAVCLEEGTEAGAAPGPQRRHQAQRPTPCLLPDEGALRVLVQLSLVRHPFPPLGVVLPPVLCVLAGGSDLQVGWPPPEMPSRRLDRHARHLREEFERSVWGPQKFSSLTGWRGLSFRTLLP